MIELNGHEIEFKRFPNGELIFDKLEIDKTILYDSDIQTINWVYEDESDLFKIMVVKGFVSGMVDLTIQYMPYSRMDRDNVSYVFTLAYITEFINSLKFRQVLVFDSHSDVTPALLNNCIIRHKVMDYLIWYLEDLDFDSKTDYLFMPDAGAQKRYADHLDGYNVIVGFKERDFKTGNIKRLQVMGETDNITDQTKVVIIDDLCSRGGTFMYAANGLRAIGFDNIYLAVGHCENTIHSGDIFVSGAFRKVYTTDSIKRDDSKQPNIINMENLAQ